MKEKLKKLFGFEPWEQKIKRLPISMDAEETEYVINTITEFLDGTGGAYDWDDLMTAPKKSQEAEQISALCCALDSLYPPQEKGHFCNQHGVRKLNELVELLQKENRTNQELMDFIEIERKKAEPGNREVRKTPAEKLTD